MHLSFSKAKISFILLTLMLVSGCGFHIKHNDGLADKYPQIYVQSNIANRELVRFIKMRLRGAGIEVTTAPSADVTILKIDNIRSSSRTISLYVSAENAEEELGYNLNYSIQDPGYPAKSFTFNLYRDFLEDSEEALAKSREEELLEQEMHSIAADHIITTMLSLNKETDEPLATNDNDK